MEFHEFLHERQADADALIFATRRAVHLKEAAEDIREILGRNADAGIGDTQHQLLPFLVSTQLDTPASGSELEGVELEVDYNLLELVAVQHGGADFRSDGDNESNTLVLSHLLGGAGHALKKLAQRHRFATGLHDARVEADEVEEIVDELEKAQPVAMHRVEQPHGILVQRLGVASKDGFER